MRINTNIPSLNAIESGNVNNSNISNSLEKLSSGLRVNKASDDASGLAIADKLRTQVSSISQSIDNANSAVTMIQIADKAMAEQSNILDIVKQKLIQAATATTSSEGDKAIAKDINKLLNQLDNISSQTNYNGVKLLENDAGNATLSLTFQVGETSNNVITTSGNIQSNTDGLASSATIALSLLYNRTAGNAPLFTQNLAKESLATIDQALNELNSFRSDFGSTQNQIESATRNMLTQRTNIAAAESILRDVDYAAESSDFNKYNVISQSSTYAQSQANLRPESILQLLT
jgi:flagellin